MRKNILLNTDSYKASHFLQYPHGTEIVSSYIESRGSEYPEWTHTTFFGLQMFLMEYLSEPFTQEDIEEADEILTAHGEPFNREGWQYILDTHDGKLPVCIQAIPEGFSLKTGNVMVQIKNTDPEVPWLTSYLETALLRAVWYPTTVATQDMAIKKAIMQSLKRTSDSENPNMDAMFKLHDFGARGTSSNESAGIGGLAHLVHFMGTDTVESLRYARAYYGADMAGFSIPAAEHSTITVWGGPDQEIKAFENMIVKFAGEGKLYATVSDSYDIMAACRKWGSLKNQIIEGGGTLVVRPDSGDPPKVVVDVIEELMHEFGFVYNSKGFKVLPSYVRVIQGDGINYYSIVKILKAMEAANLSTDNIAFGMGGAMLQHVNRDTLNFAMKASAARVDGQWRDVYKDPITQSTKKSKRGRLALIQKDGEYKTIREEDLSDSRANQLKTVYMNGNLLMKTTLDEVRERALEFLMVEPEADTFSSAA